MKTVSALLRHFDSLRTSQSYLEETLKLVCVRCFAPLENFTLVVTHLSKRVVFSIKSVLKECSDVKLLPSPSVLMTQTKKLTKEELEFVDLLVTQDVLVQSNVVSPKKFCAKLFLEQSRGTLLWDFVDFLFGLSEKKKIIALWEELLFRSEIQELRRFCKIRNRVWWRRSGSCWICFSHSHSFFRFLYPNVTDFSKKSGYFPKGQSLSIFGPLFFVNASCR